MFGISDYPAFVLAILVFLAIPGPGNLALLVSTAKGGVRGGLAATLGVMAGDQVLIGLAVMGVAALLVTWPAVFAVVQWLGALYLAVLGWKMIRAPQGATPVLDIPFSLVFLPFLVLLIALVVRSLLGLRQAWRGQALHADPATGDSP